MKIDPLPDQSKGRARADSAPKDVAFKVDHRLIALIFHVQVRRIVTIILHPDDDPKESAYFRHVACPLTAVYSPPPPEAMTRDA